MFSIFPFIQNLVRRTVLVWNHIHLQVDKYCLQPSILINRFLINLREVEKDDSTQETQPHTSAVFAHSDMRSTWFN